MSSPRSRTRRVSHQTSRDWSSLVSSWRTVEPFLTTTSRRSPLCTWSWDWEVVSLSHLWRLWLLSTTVTSLSAVSVTLDCHQEQLTAERESVVTVTSCVQRRSWNKWFRPFNALALFFIFFICSTSKASCFLPLTYFVCTAVYIPYFNLRDILVLFGLLRFPSCLVFCVLTPLFGWGGKCVLSMVSQFGLYEGKNAKK